MEIYVNKLMCEKKETILIKKQTNKQKQKTPNRWEKHNMHWPQTPEALFSLCSSGL